MNNEQKHASSSKISFISCWIDDDLFDNFDDFGTPAISWNSLLAKCSSFQQPWRKNNEFAFLSDFHEATASKTI
ncbi:hypothetical protein Y032_0313g2193 [Ancylostoma ceylanicum]|uniref:Uncharacterized protein n=1 Tax=Ancylostoma ceylanicum TaxID=53326 RepID=A0A016S1Y3_9BILA|nr:hypothetical protein Y032_0313g2193 [Ancylostoma ceylanicum]